MVEDIYRCLQEQLDQYSMGFPRTESGIEIEILRSLFSEVDAAMFTQMTPLLETPEAVAARLDRPEDEVAQQLDDMANRGLLFRLRKADAVKYGAIAFVHGIFEFQISSLDKGLAKKVVQYFDDTFGEALRVNGDLFLRTIPVQESIEPTQRVASYDDAIAILKSQKKIVITDCICRVKADMVHKSCDKPQEVCFMFGSMGQYYLDRGMGRVISLDEARDIMKKSHDAGLVTQPASAQNPTGMCNCCGDCCGPLAALNKHPKPASLVFSNYIAAFEPEECTGCETCLDRCQMNALTMTDNETAALNVDRCIGCGLCVTTCSSEALSLVPKPKDLQRVPPENGRAQMIAMAIKRGVL
ncbi:MAG: 4Fe-4S dicluster domain-containing protein [Myxococcota bacterium]|nr:4Fe-4S dicluster domain-containing protein [Myxococcota bacterium]